MTQVLKKILIGFTAFRQWLINYLLDIFRLPKVGEEMAVLAKRFQQEAGRLSSGVKGEAAGTRDMFITLTRFMKHEKLSRTEKRLFKKQVVNILKGTGVVIPVMLIPLPFVSTLLLILMDHLLLSMKIRILPSSFYPEERRDLMTPGSIETDLHRSLKAHEPGYESINKIESNT
jgi:hypothetical protein